jgi:hypothetical protein
MKKQRKTATDESQQRPQASKQEFGHCVWNATRSPILFLFHPCHPLMANAYPFLFPLPPPPASIPSGLLLFPSFDPASPITHAPVLSSFLLEEKRRLGIWSVDHHTHTHTHTHTPIIHISLSVHNPIASQKSGSSLLAPSNVTRPRHSAPRSLLTRPHL